MTMAVAAAVAGVHVSCASGDGPAFHAHPLVREVKKSSCDCCASYS